MSLGERFRVGFSGGGGFPLEKGKGVGRVGGWGGDRQRNQQVNAQALKTLTQNKLLRTYARGDHDSLA